MQVSSSEQIYIFFVFVFLGMICGAFFDLQRFFRKIVFAGTTRTILEDALFSALCIALIIGMSYHFNNGEMRYYQLMGIISGLLFYVVALSRIFMKICTVMFSFIHTILLRPIAKILLFLMRVVKNFTYKIRKNIVKARRRIAGIKRNVKKRGKLLKKRVKML